ncbi:MAG: hypothetical protein AVDCRST_MAG76-2189 [uncultured Acidimicrobiales bacterium]|uniref:Uncharacterized protein n=1 Tax=uncultured Acidimicrobiales bacterium TaxID=310071 RepID=A0A6J4IG35_9ACTN|nr:MAG: hypothetical protein AVDCRST_MAG76-2189 [uncultured Acidimicrobiales bacterium]
MLRVIVAVAVALVLLRVGVAVIRTFAAPVPKPPPEGELRKLKRLYRCSSCGLEIRTVQAGSNDPEPPRHCMDDMDLVKTEADFL